MSRTYLHRCSRCGEPIDAWDTCDCKDRQTENMPPPVVPIRKNRDSEFSELMDELLIAADHDRYKLKDI